MASRAPDLPPQPQHLVRYRVTLAGVSDIGRLRTRNEDTMSLVPALGIAIIADGMGGHPGGDVASKIAATTAAAALERYLTTRTGSEGAEPHGTAEGMDGAMARSVLSAHEAVRAHAEGRPELSRMGTTLTAMVVDPHTGMLVVGHVGDSRAYRLRSGKLTPLTRDDTWVQSQVEAGRLTPEQARGNPFSHILTQCIGLDEPPDPHILTTAVEAGDVYLLCTDGLVGMMDDGEILAAMSGRLAAVSGDGRAQAVARALVDEANERGGHDNVTVVVALVE